MALKFECFEEKNVVLKVTKATETINEACKFKLHNACLESLYMLLSFTMYVLMYVCYLC